VSVLWLEQYLIAHKNVTCLIVSHDSRFVHLLKHELLLQSLDLVSWTMSQQTSYITNQRKYVTSLWTARIHANALYSQLVYYPGNLSSFVDKHPEAKSYYTLAATSVKFSFPQPGSLMGVRSNTRAILRLSNCTYTYPGRNSPSLFNVSCALSLSR